MDTLFENARRIFEVASAGLAGSSANDIGDTETQDFAVLIKPDGALHFIMETPFSIEAAAMDAGARIAYRITRSRDGVRVQGRSGDGDCVLTARNPRLELLRDQPVYRMISPLLTSAATGSAGS